MKFAIAFFFPLLLLAQSSRVPNSYMSVCTLTLAASSKVCTIQQPSSGARSVQLVSVYIEPTASITVTQERNGTAATSTAATVTAVNPDSSDAATAKVWTDSNVGSGTVMGGSGATITVPTSGLTLPMDEYQLRGNGTGKNISLRTSTATATVKMIFLWREF